MRDSATDSVESGLIVLKLGGSVITDKDEKETVDMDALAAASGAIGTVAESAPGQRATLVIVHGAGSFGHHHASKHEVSRTEGTHRVAAIRQIHDSMGRLNKAVLDFLDDAGVDAVPVRPYSAARRDADANLDLFLGQVDAMLDEGFVPVLHGDVVTHAGKGATILSGDEVVAELATQLDADRIGLCSTVPGVLDDDDEVIPEIADMDDVRTYLGESESTDVTGGMAAKVEALLELDTPASIFGPDALQTFLAGEAVGTRIDGR